MCRWSKRRDEKNNHNRSWIIGEARKKIRSNCRKKEPCLRTGALLGCLISSLDSDARTAVERRKVSILKSSTSVLSRSGGSVLPAPPMVDFFPTPCSSSAASSSLREEYFQMFQEELLSAQQVVADLDAELGLDLDSFFSDLKSHPQQSIESRFEPLEQPAANVC